MTKLCDFHLLLHCSARLVVLFINNDFNDVIMDELMTRVLGSLATCDLEATGPVEN